MNRDELSRADETLFDLPGDYESREQSTTFDISTEPSLLLGLDSFTPSASNEELLDVMASHVLHNAKSVWNGELNPDFGGKHVPLVAKETPPPAHTFRDHSTSRDCEIALHGIIRW
ncbi:hypothetical protein J3R83DRAFT_5465 [Lanmaoa asiatica]|nr:hypothetical protein J3R83DRAFT_5465 [Lanmaoa asiatica]